MSVSVQFISVYDVPHDRQFQGTLDVSDDAHVCMPDS